MDHLRLIFALESRLNKTNIPNEFEEALQRFEDKKASHKVKTTVTKSRKLKDAAKKVMRKFF